MIRFMELSSGDKYLFAAIEGLKTQQDIDKMAVHLPIVKFLNLAVWRDVMATIPVSTLYVYNDQLKFDFQGPLSE